MKVFDPETKEYRKTRRISDKPPALMAAVYLYTHRRTTLVALDFDSKTHGHGQVDADFSQALTQLETEERGNSFPQRIFRKLVGGNTTTAALPAEATAHATSKNGSSSGAVTSDHGI